MAGSTFPVNNRRSALHDRFVIPWCRLISSYFNEASRIRHTIIPLHPMTDGMTGETRTGLKLQVQN